MLNEILFKLENTMLDNLSYCNISISFVQYFFYKYFASLTINNEQAAFLIPSFCLRSYGRTIRASL